MPFCVPQVKASLSILMLPLPCAVVLLSHLHADHWILVQLVSIPYQSHHRSLWLLIGILLLGVMMFLLEVVALLLFVATIVLAHLWTQAKQALWEIEQAQMFAEADWSEPVVDSWSYFQQPPEK